MNNLVVDQFEKIAAVNSLFREISLNSAENKIIPVTSIPSSVKSLLIKTISELKRNIILLLPTRQLVNETNVELNILGLGKNTLSLPEIDFQTIQEKLTAMKGLQNVILLSTYDILNLKLPSQSEIEKSTTKIEMGSELNYDELLEYFALLGYEREKLVGEVGFYSLRGSIVDFWSYSEHRPCRLEFDGDFIESIRYFDPETQRSSSHIEFVTLASKISSEEKHLNSDIFDYVENPVILASDSELTGFFKADQKQPVDESYNDENELDEELKEELYFSEQSDLPGVVSDNVVYDNSTIEELLKKNATWLLEDELGRYSDRITLNLSSPPAFNANFKLLFPFLQKYSDLGFSVTITTENEFQSKRLKDLLSEYNNESAGLIDSGRIKITELPIKSGFIAKKDKVVVLTDYQVFNKPYRTRIIKKKKNKKSNIKEFTSIKRGDYVVHENFGIGQYDGLETIKIGMVNQESIKILYAEGGVVYVNLNYLSLVKKYSSQDKAPTKLSKLGSNEWKSTKKKVKGKIKDAARELIKLYAERKATKGYTFSADTVWQKELEASFLYEPTVDQIKITEEVREDMESENPMDRLVCGDVGFGKTEIAVRAAFKAVSDGKQVAMLVPTTILAEQHYNTFKDRLLQYPVNISVLSRFSGKSKQKDILKEMSEGKSDIIIGTHRLLSKDINFKDLGLLIIDEEQRFGVLAKEKLKRFRVNVDTLTLTATPIPRTLNMSLLGARDLSIMATPPPNRQPIYTKVEKFDIVKVKEWVLHEIRRNGQIYFVHDRVQSIDKIAMYIKKHIPQVKLGIAHGQMKPSELEKVIYDFLNQKIQMLVCTKIIESGLDIANVNTIIINRADRFGLAELHQLRGRVGRSDRQAFAYLLVPSLNTITKKAVKRMQAIEEYSGLGEGFNISMRDLEIRGAGNLLGTEQSGSINSVGFDMYVKLLDEAVAELKTNEFSDVFKNLPKQLQRADTTVDPYFEINIPTAFMPDQSDRLSFYSALFSMLNIEEIDEIKDEMIDRFGKLPVVVERLIDTAILRFYASLAMFERVVIMRDKISLIFPNSKNEDYYKIKFPVLMNFVMDNYSKTVLFKQVKETMKLEIENNFRSVEETLEYLRKLIKKIVDLFDNMEQEAEVVESEKT